MTKIGTTRPARVLVRFLGEEFEGRDEWVPPARLKVPWTEVEEFVLREARWSAVIDASSHVRDAPEDYAASLVFDELIDPALATHGYGRTAGVVRIHDLERLARFLDVPPEGLRDDRLAFVEEGALVAPWSATERIARRAARRNPEPLLRHIDREESQQRQKMMHGEWYRASRHGSERFMEPEFFAEADEQPYHRPYRELVRTWCGVEAVERRDELIELRKEVSRLGRLIQDAVVVLRDAGQTEHAARIQRDLGITIDELRRP